MLRWVKKQSKENSFQKYSEICRRIRQDMAKTLKEWSDEKVLTHYGKLNEIIKDKEQGNADLVRKKLIKIEKRSKTLAKKYGVNFKTNLWYSSRTT